MKTIDNISFKGKTVLIRVDFNVPLDKNFNITDNSRIVAALPTIQKVITDGGKAIIMSHLGRPKNGFEERYSLKHIVKHLSDLLKIPVGFNSDCVDLNTTSEIDAMLGNASPRNPKVLIFIKSGNFDILLVANLSNAYSKSSIIFDLSGISSNRNLKSIIETPG